jgi:hypothetical protein
MLSLTATRSRPGWLQCDSAESGITCRDTTTRHGFAIAREAYQVL